MDNFEIFSVSTLEKIMPDKRPLRDETVAEAFRGEDASFQVAFFLRGDFFMRCKCRVDGISPEHVGVFFPQYVPCTTLTRGKADDYRLFDTPALVPDALIPANDNGFPVRYGMYGSLFIKIYGTAPAGKYDLTVSVINERGETLGSCAHSVSVLPAELEKGKLIYTDWMHYDCICHTHNVKMFSQRFYKILGNYIDLASEHGMNMLLVPLFTPPLDTAKFAYRDTCQLIGVKKNGGSYSFDFSLFEFFISFIRMHGIEYFELSHLFSQWGAEYAPKIVSQDGELLFGWDTRADSEEYISFLSCFLPLLGDRLKSLSIADRCFFHVSDEPVIKQIESYSKAKALISRYLPGFTTFDAMSDYGFYQSGLTDIPVAATDRADEFLKHGVSPLFVYYCCGQEGDYLSNRFMFTPHVRIRVLGFQLYINNISGFLHWGYNFYNSQLSLSRIDPYSVTDAGGAFQSGDAFCVYPYGDGAASSLRLEAFSDGLRDYRALLTLEKTWGREKTLSLLYEHGFAPGFHAYPRDNASFNAVCEKIAEIIKNNRGIQ